MRILAFLALLLSGCALSPVAERPVSKALPDDGSSLLSRALRPDTSAHPGKTGIFPLPVPRDAFAARGLLAGAATRSIDAQYYIWHGDRTGTLLADAMWKAAERGVRVRLLLDDNNTSGLDRRLATLDAHQNIEVRLYNPLKLRGLRMANYLTEPGRLNRRMHNKSFTVDGVASIVGGRNVGDEYFAAGGGVAFADLDVLAVGAAVQAVSAEFDLYWNSASAYPAAALLDKADAAALREMTADFGAMQEDPLAADYLQSLRDAPLVGMLKAGRIPFEWTEATLLHDDPAKTLDNAQRKDLLLLPRLFEALGKPLQEFDLVSPYFVPTDDGAAELVALARRGVKLRVLTNSLASTDVLAVHSGYARHRKALLRAGIRLFEIRPDDTEAVTRTKKKTASSAALHAKTMAVDRARVFVGSFNFDPRSALLNTEMGLVIASPALAGTLGRFFDTDLPKEAYEVRLASGGDDLVWIERDASGAERRFTTEPGATLWRRMGLGILSILPIESLL